MTKISWDKTGERYYETGVDNCALYLQTGDTYAAGVAWNGVSSVSEKPSGGDSNAIYADNIKYLDLTSKETFGASIEAYTYPDEWAVCDGSAEPIPGVKLGQQARKRFGLVYRSRVGNDSEGDSLGHKLHLIYNCKASPSERSYSTVNESPEALSFSWEITTTEVSLPQINGTDYRPISNLTVDSVSYVTNAPSSEKTKRQQRLAILEQVLFGTNNGEIDAGTEATPIETGKSGYLPKPEIVLTILDTASTTYDTYAKAIAAVEPQG